MPAPLLQLLKLHPAPASRHRCLGRHRHGQLHVRMRRHEGLLLRSAAPASAACCGCCSGRQVGVLSRGIEHRARGARRVRLDVRHSQGKLRKLRGQPLLIAGSLPKVCCWQHVPLGRMVVVRRTAGHGAASRHCRRAAMRNPSAAAFSKASSAEHCGGRLSGAARAACSCCRFAERLRVTASSRLASWLLGVEYASGL